MKLTPLQVQEVKEKIEDGVLMADLASEYGVTYQTIYRASIRNDSDSRTKITIDQAKEIKRRLKTGKETQTAIAKVVGCSQGLVSDIATGKTWSWL